MVEEIKLAPKPLVLQPIRQARDIAFLPNPCIIGNKAMIINAIRLDIVHANHLITRPSHLKTR
jgi:hypothetical protein